MQSLVPQEKTKNIFSARVAAPTWVVLLVAAPGEGKKCVNPEMLCCYGNTLPLADKMLAFFLAQAKETSMSVAW